MLTRRLAGGVLRDGSWLSPCMKFLLTCGAKPFKMSMMAKQQQQQPYAKPMVRKNEERGRRRSTERVAVVAL